MNGLHLLFFVLLLGNFHALRGKGMLLQCCWRGFSPAKIQPNNINKKVEVPRRGCTYGPKAYADCHEDCRNTRVNIKKSPLILNQKALF